MTTDNNVVSHDEHPAHKTQRIVDTDRQSSFNWCNRCKGWYEPLGAGYALSGGRLHNALLHTVTEYDCKQADKPFYNRYALPQYCAAITRVGEELERGHSLRQALLNNFCGRLLDKLFKAVGQKPATREEKMGGL